MGGIPFLPCGLSDDRKQLGRDAFSQAIEKTA